MEESVGALMRLFSHAPQNGLDQFTDGRIMVLTSLRLHAIWSRPVYDSAIDGRPCRRSEALMRVWTEPVR